MFASSNINKTIQGFILTELMLGATLSLMLLSILLNIYLTVRHSYSLQKSLNTIQENAQLASDIFTTEIHKAGYIGCPHLTEDFPLISHTSHTLTSKNKLTGTSVPTITVRYADFPSAVLIQPMHTFDTLYTSNNVHFSPGDVLIISDCQNAEIFKLKNMNRFKDKQKLVSVSPLNTKFLPQAEVSRLIVNQYFIAKTNDQNNDEQSSSSLFVENILHRKTELVGGIDKMQVLFSIIQEGNIVEVPAEMILDWSKIMGVAIHFNMVSNLLKKNWHLYVAVKK